VVKQVFAVVHVRTAPQAEHNLRIAEETGCDGAFLISHGEVAPQTLWEIYFQMRRATHLSLGINQLAYPTSTCISQAYTLGKREGLAVPMIWADNYKNTHPDQSIPEVVKDFKDRLHEGLVLFGGVAFKHQPEEGLRGDALAQEACLAVPHVDVLTTSGIATGTAPAVEKVRIIREAIGPHARLAVASGITPENVEEFLPYVDCFLVASGISKDFYTLDAIKAHRLTRQVKQ